VAAPEPPRTCPTLLNLALPPLTVTQRPLLGEGQDRGWPSCWDTALGGHLNLAAAVGEGPDIDDCPDSFDA
jgi:hypothetical protein